MALISQLSYCWNREQDHLWLWQSTYQKLIDSTHQKNRNTPKKEQGDKMWFPLILDQGSQVLSFITAVKGIACLHLEKCQGFTSALWVKILNAFFEEMSNISLFSLVSQHPKELTPAETKCFKMLKNGFCESCSEHKKLWKSKK